MFACRYTTNFPDAAASPGDVTVGSEAITK